MVHSGKTMRSSSFRWRWHVDHHVGCCCCFQSDVRWLRLNGIGRPLYLVDPKERRKKRQMKTLLLEVKGNKNLCVPDTFFET
jgi:hypothetical protein